MLVLLLLLQLQKISFLLCYGESMKIDHTYNLKTDLLYFLLILKIV